MFPAPVSAYFGMARHLRFFFVNEAIKGKPAELLRGNCWRKEDKPMWSFMTQPGLTTTVLDLTTDLSWLGIGLLSLTALAAGSIAFMAIRYHVSQRTKPAAETTPVDYRKAA